jgi:hypothetical protein
MVPGIISPFWSLQLRTSAICSLGEGKDGGAPATILIDLGRHDISYFSRASSAFRVYFP